jgi:hypothetical protein
MCFYVLLLIFCNADLQYRWTFNDPLRAKYNEKMAAMDAPIAKPKGSKKLKDWESRWSWSSEIMYEDVVLWIIWLQKTLDYLCPILCILVFYLYQKMKVVHYGLSMHAMDHGAQFMQMEFLPSSSAYSSSLNEWIT